jgi:DNA repair exonuclease SbcCD ATPase subunit
MVNSANKVQQVRAELESLKQKQEEIEREKARLEELKRRQDSLEQGRSDTLDKLTRALVVVQRETEESRKRVEQMHAILRVFQPTPASSRRHQCPLLEPAGFAA